MLVGRNCVCGRWVPSFAERCGDCDRPFGRLLYERLRVYLTTAGNARSVEMGTFQGMSEERQAEITRRRRASRKSLDTET